MPELDLVEHHPHQAFRGIPVRLDPEVLRSLSRLRPARAICALLTQWAVIISAITAGELFRHPIAWFAIVFVIGSRQHALAIIAHDAVHFRFLPGRTWNDWIADLCAAWPTFLSVEVFRSVHGTHHRYVGERHDGNRIAWNTHDKSGRVRSEWTYPKSWLGFTRDILSRTAVWTGLLWILRAFRAPARLRWPWWKWALLFGYYGALVTAIVLLGWTHQLLVYWLLPYCTWHVATEYIRLVCEHSGVLGTEKGFDRTRTTVPGLVGRIFVLPCNVGYHIEHHWYPSIPWYNLPALHNLLLKDPSFVQHAELRPSIPAALRRCLTRRSAFVGSCAAEGVVPKSAVARSD